MTEPLTVTLRLHGPIRVSLGHGRDGVDAVLDPNVIPATTLKGVMRAAAERELGLPDHVVRRVFGSVDNPCAWGWSDAVVPAETRVVTQRVRIPVDPDSGAAARGGLMLAEELWLRGEALFTISRIGFLADAAAEEQRLLLAASARAVTAIGASRRRGLGWATLRETPEVDLDQVLEAIEAARGAEVPA